MDVNSKKGSPSFLAPPPQQLRSSARLREKGILFQVSDNPSLREEIIKHAIIGKDGVDRRTACNLRLVHSSWNDGVLKILWKAHEPLFTLCLAIGGFPDSSGGAMNKIATQFCRINERTPPLRFEIAGNIKKPEDLDKVSNVLARCGSQFVQMGIHTCEVGEPFQNLLPNWNLPHLQKLDVAVTRGVFRHLLATNQVAVSEEVTAYLINSVLSGATALTEVEIISESFSLSRPIPPLPILESVTFPPTLTKIVIAGEMAPQDLELLTVTPRYLTSLTLSVDKILFENGLFFRILDNCRRTLKFLSVTDEDEVYEGPPRDAKMIGFPVMEQLEQLSITSIHAELEEEISRSLAESLPKLLTLRLRVQTGDMFRKWTEHSKFDSVTTLEVVFADDNEHEDDLDKFFVSVSAETMRMANYAFPNLGKLELGVSKEDTSGLEYVFREMRQLTELKIWVCSVESEESTDIWDSILTGVPIKMIEASKKQPAYLAKIEHRAENENAASIKNLQELVRFSLEDFQEFLQNPSDQDSVPKPYFSDFTFDHALLQMPKLRSVDAKFQASDETRERWLSEGRIFL